MIAVRDLEHRYGDVVAVRGLTFAVGEGELFGLLGPNGAGKSTTIKILSTLLHPSGGSAEIASHDVVRQSRAVRQALGLLFQEPALDDRLTARENLLVHCMIYGVPSRQRRDRIVQALAWIGLEDHTHALVRTFSGGMRRRLEVARALLHRPRVLLLDEPTTGLDPQTRRLLWEKLAELRSSERITILMTTHYIEEAERCDRVAILDQGAIAAEGTPAELRKRAGSERVTLRTADDARAAREIAERFGLSAISTDEGLDFVVDGGEAFLGRLAGFPIEIRSLLLRRPTLEDAFIALCGRSIRAEEVDARSLTRRAAKMRGRLR